MAAIGRVLLIPKGTYSGSTVYNKLDWVRYNGKAWVCKVDGTVAVTPVEGDNWTLLAADGDVSGNVEWDNVNDKPFDDIDTDDFDTNADNELVLNRGTFGTVTVVSDSGLTPTTTNLEAVGDATIKLKGGNNVTLAANDSANPKEITINASGGGTGGHNMIPEPEDDPDEDDVVTAVINAVTTDGGENDDVLSAFGIASWSNTMSKTFLVKGIAGSSTPIGVSGIGTWPADMDNPTAQEEATWIKIPALYGIGAVGKENIEVKIMYDPAKSGTVVLGGWIIDDDTDTHTAGRICVKFANEISEADTHTAVVGIKIIINRTETVDVSTL